MGNSLVTSRGLLAKVVAATAIALFWCVNAVGTVGITSLATAASAVTTPAQAGERHRNRNRDGRRRRHRRRRYRNNRWEWYWWQGPWNY
jgi:hypothetical protein